MYYAKVNWFNTTSEEDELSFMFICAGDWNDAMQKVSSQFEWINSIEMTEVSAEKCDVVFVPEHLVNEIMEENLT